MYQPTQAIIHLNRFKYNILNIKKHVGKKCKICLAIKANAYGHGAIVLAFFAQENKLADFLGVATVSEGVELRENGITLPILKFSPCLSYEIPAAIDYKITLTVASLDFAKELSYYAKLKKITIPVHIKVDTGMGRIGFKYENSFKNIKKIVELENIKIEGLYTHFPSSDEKNKDFSFYQIKLFKKLISKLENIGINIPIKHMANSGAIFDITESFFDMVRPGIMIYGYPPSNEVKKTVKIKPVMTLITKVNSIKLFNPGETISYGRTYTIKNKTYIAVLPAGYADGYNRLLSNKSKVIINNNYYPQVGRVCMDQIMINLGLNHNINIGDTAILMGKSKNKSFTAFDMAKIVGTISYEILCNINKRVPRIYINEEKITYLN